MLYTNQLKRGLYCRVDYGLHSVLEFQLEELARNVDIIAGDSK